MYENGSLAKLTIQAYSDPQLSENKKVGEPFKALINPEKYALGYKTEYQSTEAVGDSAPTLQFVHSESSELEFEFLFDRSGVFPEYQNDNQDGVEEDIRTFKKVVFQYNGDIHKPNYLKINWGTLDFNCVLLELNIEYKLFRPDGKPIRALAKTKFRSFIDEDLRVATENASSPDLTHVRTVKEGDTLPLMTHRIYGDSRYYLEVAKANKISNFRKLRVGQEIVFPPLQKPVGSNG